MGAQRTTASTALAGVLLSAAVFIVAQAAATTAAGTNKEAKGLELVAEACKNLTIRFANKSPHLDEDTCVSVLRSDQRSAVAKDHGDLVLVAYDLMDRRVNDTVAKMESFLRRLPRPPSADVQDCATSYARMTPTLPVFRDQFEQWKQLGKKATKLDVIVLFNLLDFVGSMAEECTLDDLKSGHYPGSTDDFSVVVEYIRLVSGLTELATGHNTGNHTSW